MTQNPERARTAVLYRMVMPGHVCPYGLKSKDLLKREGFAVDDRHLESREETDAFQTEHGVSTTPQAWIDGERVGGYDDLREYFGQEVPDEDAPSYRPVLAIFTVALLMAAAVCLASGDGLFEVHLVERFLAISMTVLALEKLQDIESFSTMFLNYDLLAARWVPYAYAYPYAEALAGLLMLAGWLLWIAAPVALVLGTVGAVSVAKAVYVDRRKLECACVGGSSRVPLGFVSLTENLMMIAMGLWMPLRVWTG